MLCSLSKFKIAVNYVNKLHISKLKLFSCKAAFFQFYSILVLFKYVIHMHTYSYYRSADMFSSIYLPNFFTAINTRHSV